MLLRKGVYSYEFMNEWEKFNEAALPEKGEFYSNLNMEDSTDADYVHGKRVGESHDFYLKNGTLLLPDVFENFRKMCLKIYHLDLVKFISATGLARQAALKKTELKLNY